ncbi:MAG: hypothetical protein HPY66_1651 [Firmicutes bacterium]|nr:hypothetical protein [Bacillota bacterium]
MIGNFIKAKGQACSILRTPPVDSKVSMTLATRGYSDNRELFREGLILADSELQGGEVFTVGAETFLTRSVSFDPQCGQIAFMATKANAVLSHQRAVETVVGSNIVLTWQEITANVYATAEAITAALLREEPGLLPNTKWIFYISSAVPILKMDRLQFADGTKCQVEDIDRLRLLGLLRIQCSDDLRLGELEEDEEP